MSDQDIGNLLRTVGALPLGLPVAARARLDRLALAGAPRPRASWSWPVGWGIAAGVLVALGGSLLLRPEPPMAWERAGAAWQPVPAGPLARDPGAWREIRLPDGTVIDAAPDARFEIVGRRPGLVARLDEGTAYFSVPSGKGNLEVAVPGGHVEVLGTAFGITVRGQGILKGETRMSRKPWMIGAASAVVAVGVTSGIVRYVGAADGAPAVAVKAGEQLELDRQSAARLSALQSREEALALQERILADREAALAERERRLAEVAPVPAPAQADPPAAALSPEEQAKAEMMEVAKLLGQGLGRMVEAQSKEGGISEDEQMRLAMDLMGAMNALTQNMQRMKVLADQGLKLGDEVELDALLAGFDAFMPANLKPSEEQKVKLRHAMLQMQREAEMKAAASGKPIETEMDPGQLLGENSPLHYILTPEQSAHVAKASAMLGGASGRLQISFGAGGAAPEP